MSKSSTDLHQTYHRGSVLRDVVTYCFWWKSEILTSVKPEVELIFTIALFWKITLTSNISRMMRYTMLNTIKVR